MRFTIGITAMNSIFIFIFVFAVDNLVETTEKIQWIFFSLIHLVDSFMIYHHVHKKKRFRLTKESVASSSSGDLQALLLTEEQQDAA
jgi:hypothetical protein